VFRLGRALVRAWIMKSGCRVHAQILLAVGLKALTVLGIWFGMRREKLEGNGLPIVESEDERRAGVMVREKAIGASVEGNARS
jgi:hypothetical protein